MSPQMPVAYNIELFFLIHESVGCGLPSVMMQVTKNAAGLENGSQSSSRMRHFLLLTSVHELTPFTWPSPAHAWKNSRHSGSAGPYRLALTTSAASSSVPATLNSSNHKLFMILCTHSAISELHASAHLIS